MIQKFVRGFRASKLAKEKLYHRTMVIRIQRFYKRRYSQRFKRAIVIQKFLKGMITAKKQRPNILIFRAVQKLDSVHTKRKTGQYFRTLILNHKAVTIQKSLRRLLARTHLKMLRQNKARSDIHKLF